MKLVTVEQLRSSAVQGMRRNIPHGSCSICEETTFYYVDKGRLFFDGSCGCATTGLRHVGWQHAVDWINAQLTDERRTVLAARFGVTL